MQTILQPKTKSYYHNLFFDTSYHCIQCSLSVSFNNVSVIVNLKNSPTNEFFTIEVLHITYKINEFSTNMHLKLLTINKMKYKSNHLYVKMALLLSGDINLNPGPVTRHQLNDPKFEAFKVRLSSSKEKLLFASLKAL